MKQLFIGTFLLAFPILFIFWAAIGAQVKKEKKWDDYPLTQVIIMTIVSCLIVCGFVYGFKILFLS